MSKSKKSKEQNYYRVFITDEGKRFLSKSPIIPSLLTNDLFFKCKSVTDSNNCYGFVHMAIVCQAAEGEFLVELDIPIQTVVCIIRFPENQDKNFGF
jgi:hypothetical protein